MKNAFCYVKISLVAVANHCSGIIHPMIYLSFIYSITESLYLLPTPPHLPHPPVPGKETLLFLGGGRLYKEISLKSLGMIF